MAVQETYNKYEGLINSIGGAGLNSIFPNDFEHYLIALELLTSDNRTIDYFAFPVSPESIQQIDPQITNVKKTAGGISSLSSTTFVPKEISLKGTFGRRFRILFQNPVWFSAFKFSGVQKKEDLIGKLGALKKASFDPAVKTGYGCSKILQSICDKSTMVDDYNKPFKLFFYNPILGDNYMVKVMDLTLSQSKESNRIVYYNLRLKAIAPLSNNITSILKSLTIQTLQKGVNEIVSNVKNGLVDGKPGFSYGR